MRKWHSANGFVTYLKTVALYVAMDRQINQIDDG